MKTNPTLSVTFYDRRLPKSVFGVFAAAWMLGISYAGTNTYCFNSADSTNGLTIFRQGGGGYLRSSGGSPYDPEVTDSSTNGCFVMTDSVAYQRGIILFPDFDSGLVVKAFQFTCDVRVGAGSGTPADGFSICFARADDPLLINNNGGGWAPSPCGEADLPEEGTQTGLAACFDAWDSGCGDVIGLTIRVDNTVTTNISLPFANLAPSDPNFAASLQTGGKTAGLAGLSWQPLSVEYTTTGMLNVAYKGVTLLTNFLTPLSPIVGRLILGGRTGGNSQNQHIDNLRIETVAVTTPVVGSASGNPYGFTVSIFGGGTATPDTNTLTVQLDGVTIVSHGTNVSSQTVTVSKSECITRIAYSQSAPFVGGTTHSVRVIVSGTAFSGTVDETRLFVAPTLRYVNINSANPMLPYADWATAATNIQDAVDAAEPGDEIVVTNGVYKSGGRAVYGTMTNRVAVDKPLTLRSVNGPEVTVIQGRQVPGTTNGNGAIRCVYLTTGATLSGFTLTNGATKMSGDYDKEQTGGGVWCLSTSAVLSNCVLAGNAAYNNSGGASLGTLINCKLVRNFASANDSYGGGATGATLKGCVLNGNSATYGGGSAYGTLFNCRLTHNLARSRGGGACYDTLNNCMLTENSASSGGGVSDGVLNGCALTANSATYGGGAYWGTLNNCTLTGNSAAQGGGTYLAKLNNCIVYYNKAAGEQNAYGGEMNYCCTTPVVSSGKGNINSVPQLASASHLSAGSPCRAAGNAALATGTDIDGEPWANPPSIGCDEYREGATGPLSVAILANVTNLTVGIGADFQAVIEGWVSSCAWDFGDGGVANDCPSPSHIWWAAGDYRVTLTAYNETYPGGVSASVTVQVTSMPARYVSLTSTSPLWPYSSWQTAATNINDAVDAAAPGDLILVSNGVYQTGVRAVSGKMTNRVAVTKPVTVLSVNGPEATSIVGYQMPGTICGPAAVRCVYLTNGATLSGFTLTNGATQSKGNSWEGCGGGVFCESDRAVLYNCVLAGNSAYWGGGGTHSGTLNNCTLMANSARDGGGAWGAGSVACTLNNCLLVANSASGLGGGVCSGLPTGPSVLNNCTLLGNSASGSGGGAYYSTLNNCISYYNSAAKGANYYAYYAGRLNYCCTTPLPSSGTGNISDDPQLASLSHLSSGSPCRGAGNRGSATGTDCDGEPWANPCSMGCDEYYSGSVTGALRVAVVASFTKVAAGFSADFRAAISGRVNASKWDFGDGLTVRNQPYVSHAWPVAGDYKVTLTAYNETYPSGVSTTLMVRVENEPIHYVSLESTTPRPPYSSWTTAATNINDAVESAIAGGTVLVSNGVYKLGARALYGMSNRLAITKPITVRSVHGPEMTTIQGYQVPITTNGAEAVRCAYLTNGAVLAGFTLANGATQTSEDPTELPYKQQCGGGVWLESVSAMVSNCVLRGNSCDYGGGGAYRGTLNNCTLTGNSSDYAGGGAYNSSLNNCTLATNAVSGYGGGAYECTLDDCTLRGNSSEYMGGGAYDSSLNNCVLAANVASAYGGGVAALRGCTLNNCTLTGNSSDHAGGGAYLATLNNCTLTGNSAKFSGGGAWGYSATSPCYLNNCIVYFNTAPSSSNYGSSTLNYCCTVPLPASGTGNIDAQPLFVDYEGGNLRLQPNSPCINAGNNTYVITATDLVGNPRVIAGTVDMGAYEFVPPNRAPIADANATAPLVISPNGTNASLVLDGSRSSDPDGDPLQYTWWEQGSAVPLATGVVALVTLPVGNHLINLVVSDGWATSTNAVTVAVLTTGQAVQRLISLVNQSALANPRPLTGTLEAALASLNRGNSAAAANQLRAFQNKVRAQVAPSDPALAASFIQAAQDIIEAIDGRRINPGVRPHGRLTAKHQPNGQVQLKFTADPGATYILEGSTNLVDWEMIGVAVDSGDGTFDFEDPNAAKFPNRFYRIVSP